MDRTVLSAIVAGGNSAPRCQAATDPAVSAACNPDALKFCRSVIRDETRRQACMKTPFIPTPGEVPGRFKEGHAQGAWRRGGEGGWFPPVVCAGLPKTTNGNCRKL